MPATLGRYSSAVGEERFPLHNGGPNSGPAVNPAVPYCQEFLWVSWGPKLSLHVAESFSNLSS